MGAERRDLACHDGEPLGHARRDRGRVTLLGAQRLRQLGVHQPDRLAQPGRLGREVAAHLVGAQVALGEQVTHARQRHRPAVGGVRGEVLQHPERRGGAVEGALDRPLQRRDLLATDRAQGPVQLQVGVEPRRDAAEQLEDRRLAVGDRRVGLLRPEHPAADAGRDLRPRLGDEADPVDGDSLADGVEQPVGDLVVPQPVVGDVLADPADGDVLQLGARVLPAGHEKLVVVHRAAVVELHGDHDLVEERLTRGEQGGGGRDLDRAHRAALRGEPPLPGQPLGQLCGEFRRPRCRSHALSSTGAGVNLSTNPTWLTTETILPVADGRPDRPRRSRARRTGRPARHEWRGADTVMARSPRRFSPDRSR